LHGDYKLFTQIVIAVICKNYGLSTAILLDPVFAVFNVVGYGNSLKKGEKLEEIDRS
jgi:hypothetical protein